MMNNFISEERKNSMQSSSQNYFFKKSLQHSSSNITVFLYRYHERKQLFEHKSDNCQKIHQITEDKLNKTDLKEYLNYVSSIIANGTYSKKNFDKITFKKGHFIISFFSIIFLVAYLVASIASAEYKVNSTISDDYDTYVVGEGTSSSRTKRNITVSYAHVFTIENSSNNRKISNDSLEKNLVYQNTDNTEYNNLADKHDNSNNLRVLAISSSSSTNNSESIINVSNNMENIEESNDISLMFILSILFGAAALVIMFSLSFLNFFEKFPPLKSINDIIRYEINKYLKGINDKLSYKGIEFQYVESTKEIEIYYYDTKKEFFKSHQE